MVALEELRPGVGLVDGLAERETGGGHRSPPAALEVVPAPGSAPHHAVQLVAADCSQVGEAGRVQVKCAERLAVRRHSGHGSQAGAADGLVTLEGDVAGDL